MLSNRLAIVALGVACVAAAAGGGYLATRQNAVPTPAAAAAAEQTPATLPSGPAATDSTAAPVQETEGVVGDTAKTAPAAATTPAAPESKARIATRPAATTPAPSRTARGTTQSTRETVRRESPPLERSWPNPSSETTGASPANGSTASDAGLQRVEDTAAAEAPRAPEPPVKTFEELVVPKDSVIGLQTDTTLNSERSRVEDRVEAHVTRAVRVNDRVAIPAGTKAIGTVIAVDRGSKFKDRARLAIRFNMLVLADGTELPISTETIERFGDAPNSAQKVGAGAIGGAILGAIIGGGKGAAIGGLAGAGGGAAVQMAGDVNAATLAAGAPVTARILSPVTVTVDAKEN